MTPVAQVVLVLSERCAAALECKLNGDPLDVAQAALLQGVSEEVGNQLARNAATSTPTKLPKPKLGHAEEIARVMARAGAEAVKDAA